MSPAGHVIIPARWDTSVARSMPATAKDMATGDRPGETGRGTNQYEIFTCIIMVDEEVTLHLENKVVDAILADYGPNVLSETQLCFLSYEKTNGTRLDERSSCLLTTNFQRGCCPLTG